jgi:hypothetical protein
MIRINIVLTGVAMAMGVACVVLAVLKAASVQTTMILLGIGLLAVSLENFRSGLAGKPRGNHGIRS